MRIFKIQFLCLYLLLFTNNIYSQLGFCLGSKGEPIFQEDFGSGTTYGPALPSSVTSYTFVNGTPNDGLYTIYNNTQMYGSWHNSPDHTPDNQTNGLNGKMLLVNASFSPGAFYKRTVTGLCVNTTFEFSAWLMNVYNAASTGACGGSGIPVNVTFEIWDTTETVLLKSGSTGDIQGISSPVWTQYGLVFTVPAGQTSVVLKMRNNGVGGCGNDLAIDDIAFSSCGDLGTVSAATVTGNIFNICQDQLPLNTTLNINVPATNTHVFQWQSSNDGISFTDIVGANSDNYNIVNLNTNKYFRVRIAQDIANLANPFCATVSNVFSVIVKNKPPGPLSLGDKTICTNEPFPALGVTVVTGSGTSVNWYDDPIAGNLIASNSTTYTPSAAGTFYAETFTPGLICTSSTRTAVKLSINPVPNITLTENLTKCQNQTIDLKSGISGQVYDWSNGATTENTSTLSTGTFTVKITNTNNCSVVKTIIVTETVSPIISNIMIDENSVTIQTANSGNFLYSIDGINYQGSNVFYNVMGGLRTAYVKEISSCGVPKKMDFLNLILPKFFSPNNDGLNDFFEIEGFKSLSITSCHIFDQFGKLIFSINDLNPKWDGNWFGKTMPANDYWYKLTLKDGKEFKGHFSIVR